MSRKNRNNIEKSICDKSVLVCETDVNNLIKETKKCLFNGIMSPICKTNKNLLIKMYFV